MKITIVTIASSVCIFTMLGLILAFSKDPGDQAYAFACAWGMFIQGLLVVACDALDRKSVV